MFRDVDDEKAWAATSHGGRRAHIMVAGVVLCLQRSCWCCVGLVASPISTSGAVAETAARCEWVQNVLDLCTVPAEPLLGERWQAVGVHTLPGSVRVDIDSVSQHL